MPLQKLSSGHLQQDRLRERTAAHTPRPAPMLQRPQRHGPARKCRLGLLATQTTKDSVHVWKKKCIIYLHNFSQLNFTVKKDTKQRPEQTSHKLKEARKKGCLHPATTLFFKSGSGSRHVCLHSSSLGMLWPKTCVARMHPARGSYGLHPSLGPSAELLASYSVCLRGSLR